VSLRARLVVAMAVIAFVLMGAAVAVTRATRANLIDRVDEQLMASIGRARGAAADVIDGRRQRNVGLSSLYTVVVRRNGNARVIEAPDVEDPTVPELTADEVLDASENDRGPFTVDGVASDGSAAESGFRVLVRPTPRGDAVMVAEPLAEVEASMSRLMLAEIIVTGSILAVLALVGWWVVRLGIRPVKQMAAAASAIGSGDLSHRVPEATPGTEVGDLGVALNKMLEQIETAFGTQRRSEERLRQFVADASHELRTPVATVRGYSELYRTGGLSDPARLDDAMRRSEQEAIRMGALVDDLLVLARLDQGRPLAAGPVRLDVIAHDAVLDACARQPDRTIHLEARHPVPVLGDEGRLRQVVTNLVANSLVHTPPETSVWLRVAARGDTATIAVHDDGPGVPPDVAAKVFERFYRADPMRARSRGGSGLGLSIVQAIVTAHGGRVGIESHPGCGTTFTVSLPLADTFTA